MRREDTQDRVWAAREAGDWTRFCLEEMGREGLGAAELAFRLSGPGDGSFAVYEIVRMAQSEEAECTCMCSEPR